MSTYGSGKYAQIKYTSEIIQLTTANKLYIGCEPTNGKESNCIFDELELFFEDIPESQILAMLDATQPSVYTTKHQLLAHFDNNLEGGNLSVDNVAVATWRIFRKPSNSQLYKLYKTINNDNTQQYSETYDYELANSTTYDYAIEGVAADGTVTNKYEVTGIKLDFDGIWLVDRDTGNVYPFYYNLPDNQFNSNKGRVEIETYSRFPKVIRNDKNYMRGSLETWKIDNPYTEIQTLREQFEGKDNLLLKFDSGEIYIVDINIPNYNYIRNTLNENKQQVGIVRCDWVQVGEVE